MAENLAYGGPGAAGSGDAHPIWDIVGDGEWFSMSVSNGPNALESSPFRAKGCEFPAPGAPNVFSPG